MTTVTEQEIVDGGKEIALTLVGSSWKTTLTDTIKQAIIDGLDSAQSETNGWNAEVRDKEVVGAVARTSNSVVTITLTAAPDYNIEDDAEVITATIPTSALNSGLGPVAVPTFDIELFVPEDTASAGGWALGTMYDRYRDEREKREEEEKKKREAIKALKGTDAEIANLMHKQLRREARDAEIASLEAMIQSTYTTLQLEKAREYNENVARAYAKAVSKGGFSAIEAFEREMEKAREEEDFLVLVMMALS